MSLSFDPPPEDTTIRFDGPTCLEHALYARLEEEGISFIPEWQVPGTNYRIDAYDSVNKIGYEADGYPTHFTAKGIKRDKIRDQRILATGEVVKMVRYTYKDLIFWL